VRNIKSGNFNFTIHQGGQARLNFVKQNLGGQVMILTTLAIGGALLGATAIAGLLMVYQIRQMTDLRNSTQAIMAADSGVEWGFFQFFHPSSPPISTNPNLDPNSGFYVYLPNGAYAVVNCYGFDINDPSNREPLLPNCSNASSIVSVADAAGASRALKAYIQALTGAP
jgi:hypothetical protein